MDESELDGIFAELARIATELSQLPDDDFAARAELQSRRDELRAAAARVRPPLGGTPRPELERRLAALQQMRARHIAAHVPQSAGAQTGMGGGIDPEYVHRLHRTMDEAFGLAEIDEEIRALRRLLDEQS